MLISDFRNKLGHSMVIRKKKKKIAHYMKSNNHCHSALRRDKNIWPLTKAYINPNVKRH